MNKISNDKLTHISRIIVATLIFIVGVSSLYLYYFLQTSDFLFNYINKIGENSPHIGLKLLSFFGIVKITTLVFGTLIIVALIYVLIQRNNNKKHAAASRYFEVKKQ